MEMLVTFTVICGGGALAITVLMMRGWWRRSVFIGAAVLYAGSWVFARDLHTSLGELGPAGHLFAPVWCLVAAFLPVVWIHGKEFYPYTLLQHRKPDGAKDPGDA